MLVKRIGKIVGLLALVAGAPAFARVRMQLTDVHGRFIKQADAGVPFIVQIVIDGEPAQIANFPGLDAVHVQGPSISQSIRTVNGVTDRQTVYRYVVRFDQAGAHELGPIELQQAGVPMTLDVVSLVVRPAGARTHESVRGAPYILEMATDTSRAVIGQRIPITVRLYYQTDIQLQCNLQPSFAGFDVAEHVGTGSGTAERAGSVYQFVEWQYTIFGKQAGSFVIPALMLDLAVPTRRRSFFGPSLRNEQVQSNALAIAVDPLPPYDGPVHAVGSFSRATLSADCGHADGGQAIVVRLAVEGDGTAERVQAPRLDVPKSFTAYESRSEVTQTGDDAAPLRKTFEYVVQGMRKGDWRMPEQNFVYFDPSDKKYHTLYTQPLSMRILSDVAAGPAPPVSSGVDEHAHEPALREVTDDGLAPLCTYGALYPARERALPLGWFVFLCVLVAALPGLWHAWCRWLRYRKHKVPAWRARGAFKAARRSLLRLQNENERTAAYHVFLHLFADRWQIPHGKITHAEIEQRLREIGVSDELCVQWRTFAGTLSQQKFFAKDVDDTHFWHECQAWLQRLQERL